MQSLLQLIGLDWAVPDFSTLCRRQRTLNVSLPYRGETGPLNFLIDSTGINIGDALVLPDLLNEIPPYQDIDSVTADGAYDTRKCQEAIAVRNAHAVIPPRKNAKP